MKNLGKIALLLGLIIFNVDASVKARLSSKSVELGEMMTYSLQISGENISRPNIRVLCGEDVISTSSQTSIEMINGDISRSNILSYKFMPQKSCEIEPIEVEIDGVIQKSNTVSFKVQKMVASKDADFILTLQTDVREVFVGEPFEVTLLFKHKNGAEAVDSQFTPPKLKGFWIKSESKPTRVQDGEYGITKINYIIAAQRVGKLKITKAKMRIASRVNSKNSWGSFASNIKWRAYFSNELNIEVKALPTNVNLVGSFSIMATPDKLKVDANEALSVTIEVLGSGNLEDIKNFKPHIDGVNIFEEKISIVGNRLTQKIVFVAERDFIIAPFELKYFDPVTKEIKTTSTNEIKIDVINEKPKEELTIKRDDSKISHLQNSVEADSTSLSNFWIFSIYVLGLLSGVGLMLLKSFRFVKKDKKPSIKDPKILLVKLLPYESDKDVQKILDILEKNIYSDAKIAVDKKLIKEILNRYKIS